MKLLIADDDPVMRLMLVRFLRSWGHEVHEAQDGDEALRALETQGPFEAMLLDWMMPGMDGPEVCRRVRARETDEYLYIFMLTSRGGREDYLTGMNAGADDFFQKPFEPDELRVRLVAAERVIRLRETLARQNRELREANERIRRDLETAARVQREFLPAAPPAIAGFRFAWEFLPCEYVAGDAFNVFALDEFRWGFYILDVSGHGIPSALLSVTLSRLLSASAEMGGLLAPRAGELNRSGAPALPFSPAEVARALNARFPMEENAGLYFTLLYAILDTRTGEVEWARAGHLPPLWLPRGEAAARLCESEGAPPIGLISPDLFACEVDRLTLAPGDRLFLYSDGLVESFNENDTEMFGQQRLAALLGELGSETLDAALRRAVASAGAWARHPHFADDVTLLGLERAPQD